MSKIIVLTYKTFEEIFLKKYLIGVFVISLVFGVITVKVKNIELGYEINRLKKESLEKEIKIESLERKISKIKSTANLLKKSKELNLELPEFNRVFYVE
ncbi:hypothetical protein FHQ18_08925 [Deferribacter autotrophicus]|uniref:Cell division protein FtsL n=1 Tax=Deferribacter autotrophicus TaxID=500465 RepID=A0A5A8F311_9BACT|nr:hypothetical protein [Deferribacter autotrophicus]KAA0257854.1 hypothetical protein FHQ18_08925 [Deferribacter autotrophicus]